MVSIFEEAVNVLKAARQEVSDRGGMPYHLKMNGLDDNFVLAKKPKEKPEDMTRMTALMAVLGLAYDDWRYEQRVGGGQIHNLPGLVMLFSAKEISIEFAAGEFTRGLPLRALEQGVLQTRDYLLPQNYNNPASPVRERKDGTIDVVIDNGEAVATQVREVFLALGEVHGVGQGLVKGMGISQSPGGMPFYVMKFDKEKYEAIRDAERGVRPDLPNH